MLISVEGNIGSGKSTLLEALQHLSCSKPIIIIPEDVKAWVSFKDTEGQTIVEHFYKNKSKFGFCFQTLVVISRIHHILSCVKQYPDHIIITERSHYTDLHIFVTTLYEHGELSEIEYLTYKQFHTLLDDLLQVKVEGIIYNHTLPSICMQRIRKRSRKGEECIPEKYIEELHSKHDVWIHSDTLMKENKVCIIDGNIDTTDNQREQILQTIQSFLNKY